MKSVVLLLAILCLVANVAPAVLFLAGRIELTSAKTAMIWATAAWYVVGGVLVYGGKEPELDYPVVP